MSQTLTLRVQSLGGQYAEEGTYARFYISPTSIRFLAEGAE
ncbi:hypothetical protein P4S72_21455 [Vibrio sp. PP-XX7]